MDRMKLLYLLICLFWNDCINGVAVVDEGQRQFQPPSTEQVYGMILEYSGVFSEPCKQYYNFTNSSLSRSPSHVLMEGEKPIYDNIRFGWYRIAGFEVPIIPSPGVGHCGTNYPVYFKENTPRGKFAEDPFAFGQRFARGINENQQRKYEIPFELFTQRTCIDTEAKLCAYEYDTPVLHCIKNDTYVYGHFVYFPRGGPGYGYCLSKAGKARVEIPELTAENGEYKYRFQCVFNASADDVWYTVSWYIDNELLLTLPPVSTTSNILESTTLHEDQLESKQLGFRIRCGYSVSQSQDSLPDNATISKSAERFIGIEILTPVVQISNNQKAQIMIRSTVPIGCTNTDLKVNVDKATTSTETCGPSSSFSNCGMSVSCLNWNETVTFEVAVDPPSTYGSRISVNVFNLDTTGIFPSHPIWQNYHLGNVTIRSGYDTSSIQGKSCHAVCDPHMRIFEGQSYEQHLGGLFTLYENKARKQEIQIKTEPCSRSLDGRPYCVCGVAVRVGKEVFVADHCEPLEFWDIKYTQCSATGAALMDIKRSGSQYKIILPTGTTFETHIYQSNKYLNVYVYPSEADVEAGGLCGKLNDNRFFARDNSVSPKVGRDVPAFSESWRVTGSVIDLFSGKITDLDAITNSSDGSGIFCKCTTPPGATEPQFTCEKAPEECSVNIGNFQSVETCKVGTLSKRSADSHLRNKRSHGIHRRGTVVPAPTWRNGWTLQIATDHCNGLFDNSSIVQACKDISNVDIVNPKNNCILDIEFMGDASFALAAVDTILAKCIHEVSYDTALQTSSPTQPSVLQLVSKVACPSECSLQGTCMNGTCACNEGLSGVDCSINTRVPPTIDHFRNDGYCDLHQGQCIEISVFGGIFADAGTTMCKVAVRNLLKDGSFEAVGEQAVKATTESISEIKCPLSSRRLRRTVITVPNEEFVQVYDVSVSNNGIDYSNSSLVAVFNSRCQTCTINNNIIECSFKGDFCISEGECYAKDEPHLVHKCYKCSVADGSRQWMKSSDGDCKESRTDRPLWIIGVVLGVIVLLGIIIVIVCLVQRSKRRSKTEFTGHYEK